MRRPRTIRLLGAASAAALLLALTGCAGDEPKTASDQPAASESPGESESEDSAPAEGDTVDSDDFLARLQAAVDDTTTASTSMTMDMGSVQTQAEGVVDYTTDPPSMSMQMEMSALGGGTMEARIVDGVMYMNMGAMTQGKFFKVDPKNGGDRFGDMTDSMDPMKSFEDLAAAFQDVVFVGEEDVDGESLNHYQLTLDTRELKSWGAGDAGAAGMPKKLTYDLWLDDEDRIRQAEMTMGSLGSMVMTMGDFGEPVEIVAPPASKIIEMPIMDAGA